MSEGERVQTTTVTRRTVLLGAALAVAACGGGSGGDAASAPAPAPTPAPPPPPPTIDGTDGAVLATALSPDGKTLYIGGEFTQVGRPTGCFVSVERSNGAVLPRPTINGVVDAALPDGSGGWYIVGLFNPSDAGIQTLGHVLPDGSLHPLFGRAVSFRASAIAISGATLFVGGSEVSGPFAGAGVVAALDLATALLVKWVVHANTGVTRLVTLGSTVYAGGFFNVMGNVPREKLAALDAVSGAVLPWNPDPQISGNIASISALAVHASFVVAGGSFQTIGGAARNCVAVLDPISGAATAWDAAFALTSGVLAVYAIASDGAVIYVGGEFMTASGRQHEGLVALDAATGADLPWDAGLTGTFNIPATVTCIAIDGDTVYASGSFRPAGSNVFVRAVALQKADATRRPWLEASLNADIRTMQVGGAQVFVGGSFSLLAGQPRNHIAAIDTGTGQVTSWNPDAPATTLNVQSGVVRHLCVTASVIYAAGSFTRIGGADRSGIAALDPTSGASTAWNPQVTGGVSAMAASSSRLFVAGPSAIDGQSRAGLVAFDLQTGALLPWAPAAAPISRLVATDATVYTNAGNGVAFDATTAAQLPWNPNAQVTVGPLGIVDMALHGGVVYLVGGFDRVGGVTRFGLAAVTASTGALLPWEPISLIAARAIAISGDSIYVGLNAGGGNPPAKAVIKLSISQATMVSGDVVEGFVSCIVLNGATRYYAGAFSSASGSPTPNIAAYVN